ncbi:MAG: hypothetical protein PHP98_03690 [Kiritimatiellae bacterium]|nr:hypothetical protein [Kiritimatiellia bacterium]
MILTSYLRTSPLAALIFCGLVCGCAAEDKPGASQPAIAPAPPPVKNIFQPTAIDPAQIRKNMQTRAEYEEMNRKVIARINELYEKNPEIKGLQGKMRELQEKIDALLAEDSELTKLKEKSRAIAPEIPAMPPRFAPPATNARAPNLTIKPEAE